MTADKNELLTSWHDKARKLSTAHYFAEQRNQKFHYGVGLPSIVCATIAGATLFSNATNPTLLTVIGIVGLVAAILTAVQTFYGFAGLAEAHKVARKSYGKIVQKIELIQNSGPRGMGIKGEGYEGYFVDRKTLQELADMFSEVSKDSPTIPYDIAGRITQDLIDLYSDYSESDGGGEVD